MERQINQGGVRTLFLVFLAITLSIWGCDNALRTQVTKEDQPQTVKSKIDGNSVITVSASDFYTANAAYTDKVIKRLSKNGAAIVEAFNQSIRAKTNGTYTISAHFVTFDDLRSTSHYKTKSANNLLDDLSSHIRVEYQDGSTEEFVLTLEKHYGGAQFSQNNKETLSEEHTWLALAPSRFYIREDEQGNEIYPVTFPAVSLDNPEVEIEVTLQEDGRLSWPPETKQKSTLASTSDQNKMIFVGGTPVMEPTNVKPCGCGGGGGGAGGGGSGGGDEPPEIMADEVQMGAYPFLALETIRTHADGDNEGDSWELQMYVDATEAVEAHTFGRKWEYVFDMKYGENGLPLAWGDGKWWQVLGGSLVVISRLINQEIFDVASVEYGSVFTGPNTRTIAVDGRVYETPDINYKEVDYNFTNMRTWELAPTYSGPKTFKYEEVGRSNYIPIVLLNDETFSLVAVEDDKRYHEMSTLTGSYEDKPVQTFNMKTRQYEEKLITIEAYNHLTGNSDDIVQGTGVNNINRASVNNAVNYQNKLKITAPNGFQYKFKKVFVEAPRYSPN